MSKEFAEPKNVSFTASASGSQVVQETARVSQTDEKKEVKKKTRTHFNIYEEWAKIQEEDDDDDCCGDSSTSSYETSGKDSGSGTMSQPVKQQVEPKVKIKADSSDLGVSRLKTPAKSINSLFTPKQSVQAKPVHSQNSVGAYLLNSQKKNAVKKIFETPQPRKEIPKPADEAKENVEKNNDDLKLKDFFKQVTVNTKTYIILNVLGKGGSSTVYDCFEPKSKTACAIKCVSLNCDMEQVNSYINEIKTLVRLQSCPRIIKLHAYQILKDKKRLLVVLEKGGKDLSIILRELVNSSTHMPLYMVIYYWMEMLYAVKEIHDKGVIHSDLKPANFLEVKGRIKLIDFGIASCVQSEMTSVIKNVSLGTFSYISPEALSNDSSTNVDSPNYGKQKFKISFKSDVWSLGCILYQLIYRKTPFQHIVQPLQKFVAISNPDHKIDYPQVDWVPNRIIQTMRDCLQHDMRSRPSVDELISQYEAIYK